MTEHVLKTNESTPWMRVDEGASAHLSIDGAVGGGTFALEKMRGGEAFPVYEFDQSTDTSTPIVYTQELDVTLQLKGLEEIRLTLSGATSPDVIIGLYSDGGNGAN